MTKYLGWKSECVRGEKRHYIVWTVQILLTRKTFIRILCKCKALKTTNNLSPRSLLISFVWWPKNSIKGAWSFIVKVKHYKHLSFNLFDGCIYYWEQWKKPLNKPGLKHFLLKLKFLNTSYCKMVNLKGKL